MEKASILSYPRTDTIVGTLLKMRSHQMLCSESCDSSNDPPKTRMNYIRRRLQDDGYVVVSIVAITSVETKTKAVVEVCHHLA